MSSKSPAQPLSRLLEHAADAVAAVRGGRSLTEALAAVPPEVRPGSQAIAFHAMRWLGVAQAARHGLANRRPTPWVDGLLLAALALAWPGSSAPVYAEHTLVDQAVRAARRRAPDAAGFVNALLRRFLRERDAIVSAVGQRQPDAANHPGWWVQTLRQDWPEPQATRLLEANQAHPPMTLRTNRRRAVDAAAYVQRLTERDMPATTVGASAVQLTVPQPVNLLPGFADGDVSVQDLNAQRAAPLLLGLPPPGAAIGDAAPAALSPGARVLDACAAPGGKTAHLLELADLELVALDHDPARLVRVGEALDRLRLRRSGVRLQAADARQPGAWWDGRPFDAILIDAPCSGSGVVRRHPDIRWLRRAEDLPAMARNQGELLDALWPLLAPGGRLVYATCSVFSVEGQDVIDAFLQRVPGPSPRVDPASPGHLLPVADNPPIEGRTTSAAAAGDGFFYALLHKPL